MGLLERAKRYRKAYENWISVMWAIYRNKPRIELKLRNGLQLEGSHDWAHQVSGLVRVGGDVRYLSDEFIGLALNGKSVVFYGWTHAAFAELHDYD